MLDFQEQFPKEGLWWPYKKKAQFEKLVRSHISTFLRQRPTQSEAATAPLMQLSEDSAIAVGPHAAALRISYLSWVIEQVRSVPLSGVDPDSIREETRRDLDLAAVYTALNPTDGRP